MTVWVLTTLLPSVRYFVIVTGHESRLLTKSSHTKVVVGSIWVLAVLVACPTLFATKISPVSYGNSTYVECTEDWGFLNDDTKSLGTIYTIVVFVLTFILPVVALTYLYGHIGIIIYKHQLPVGNDNRVTNQNLTQTKIKVSGPFKRQLNASAAAGGRASQHYATLVDSALNWLLPAQAHLSHLLFVEFAF